MSPHPLKLILLLLLLTACRNTATATASPSLHLDPTQPIPIRVAALLSLMSTPEKIAQTIAAEILQQRNVGQVGGLSCDKELYPGSNVTARNQFQKEALASKFNPHRIPLHFWHESNHGGCSGGTVFPMPINLGTTWNESLVTSVFSVIANSTLACGASIAFAPVINLFQDPRYGRFQEAFSPEPQLTSKMTTASVIGLQGMGNATTYLGKGKVIALGKHFAGYGGSPGGLNAGPLVVGERELRDVWLKPWRAFTKAGGRGAMPAHNTVLDVPAHANSWLINTVFREEFGFGEGLTISDCDDVNVLQQYRVAKDPPEAAAKGLKGGTDMDLQCGPISTYTTTNIETALARKDLTMQDLDQAVKHVLTAKFAAGLFEQPMADLAGKQWLDLPAHRALAKEAAEQSLVLLKNDNQTLPFQRFQRFQNTLSNLFKVSVLGEIGVDATGKARKAMLGTYTSDDGKIQVDTVLEAATTMFGSDAVSFALGASPDHPANTTDIAHALHTVEVAAPHVVVLVVGDSLHTCGEWDDRDDLDLPGGQLALLTSVVALKNKMSSGSSSFKIVVVVVGGRPTTFGAGNGNVLLEKVDALVWAGRPGEEGGNAIVNLLVGGFNPSGKLNANWPRTVGHVGSGSVPWYQSVRGKWVANARGDSDADGRVYDNYVDDDVNPPTPLFYFGSGLSFTTFAFAGIQVTDDGAGCTDTAAAALATVSFQVTNTGMVDGAVVGQVYVADPVGGVVNVVRPWKRLAGFTKLFVRAGETVQGSVVLTFDDLAWSGDGSGVVGQEKLSERNVVGGVYTFSVGDASNRDGVRVKHSLCV